MTALRRFSLVVALAFIAASTTLAAQSNIESPQSGAEPSWNWTPELALRIKRIRNVQPSPNGEWVSFEVAEPMITPNRSEYVTHIHLASVDGERCFQLTRGKESCSSAQWSPDGDWIAFLSARGYGDGVTGDERDRNDAGVQPNETTDLFRISIHGGEAERLTFHETSIRAFQWSPDGSHIAFVAPDPDTRDEKTREREKRDVRIMDADLKPNRLHIIPVEPNDEGDRPVRTLTPATLSVSGIYGNPTFDFAPDGRAIAFGHKPTPKIDDWPAADLSMVEVETGEIRTLLETGAAESNPHFSRDGSHIAFLRTDDPPTWAITTRVHLLDLDTGDITPLARTFDERPSILDWSPDDSSVIVDESRRTLERVYELPTTGEAPVVLNERDDLLLTGIKLDHTGRYLGFTVESSEAAPEAAFSTLDALDGPLEIVSAVQPDLSDLPMPRTEIITWTAPDGLEVEGLLTYPLGWDERGQAIAAPLLVIVHGGPAGVFRQRFIARRGAYPIAAFAERGYFVLRPNPRGSSAYGRDFRYGNMENWGDGPLSDIMGGIDHVIEQGLADPNQLGIMGWSYGGYMTSFAITRTDRFAAASVGAGVTNLLSMQGTTDIPDFMVSYFGAEYWDNIDVWRTNSPMERAGDISTPTLIQHGERDLRVPLSQATELYIALERRGVPVELAIYPRQPHGVIEPKLQLDAMQRNLDWFERWILDPADEETAR